MRNIYLFQEILILIALYTLVWIFFIHFGETIKRKLQSIQKEESIIINSTSSTLTLEQNNDDFDPLFSFFKTHEQILNEKNSSPRKIFFTLDPLQGGYGNRMHGFISSALIAILLDCQLALNWKIKEIYYLDPPFKINDSNFNSNANQSYSFTIRPLYPYPFSPVKEIRRLIERPFYVPENYTRYAYNKCWPLFTEISANIRYYDKFRLYKLARDETLDRAFEALKDHKNYSNEELQGRVLNVAFQIGGNIMNRLAFILGYRSNHTSTRRF